MWAYLPLDHINIILSLRKTKHAIFNLSMSDKRKIEACIFLQAKKVKYLTYMTFNQTTHHSVQIYQSNEMQERYNLTFLTLNMTFRTHSQCIYFSIALASPHYDVMRLKSDKEQNNAYTCISFWPSNVSLEQFKQNRYYPHIWRE